MNGETTENLKNLHLQHLLTSTNTQEQSSIRTQLKQGDATIKQINRTQFAVLTYLLLFELMT